MPRILIVGGGILGTFHALEAVRRGWEVTHFDASAEPQASTVRSPGALNWSWAATGLDLDLSLRARAAWDEVARTAPGIELRRTGSMVLATTLDEVAVLGHLAARADAERRGWTLLDEHAIRSANPALQGMAIAALHSAVDAAVEPRSVLGELRDLLSAHDGYRFLGGREVHDYGPGSVTDITGRVHKGDLVILCPGRSSSLTTSAVRQPAVLRDVHIQVAQTEPSEARLPVPVADLASLGRHGLLGDEAPVRRHEDPLLGETEVRFTCVQRASGALTLGEARQLEEPFGFDVAERPTKTFLAHLEALLGREAPPVTRQWAGVVKECTDGRLWFRETLDETVALVTGADQRGIALAPVIAADTMDWLLEGDETGATRPGAAGAA